VKKGDRNVIRLAYSRFDTMSKLTPQEQPAIPSAWHHAQQQPFRRQLGKGE